MFAVPGQIFSSNSAGTHGLLRVGAGIATSARDLLEQLGLETHPCDSGGFAAGPGPTGAEAALLVALEGGPSDIEELCGRAGLGAAEASATLSSLEIRGLVKRGAGGRFQKCRPRKS